MLDSVGVGGGGVSIPMTIELCYVFPHGDSHLANYWRFLNSYAENPPGLPHRSVILTDEGQIDDAAHLAKAVFGQVHIFQSHDRALDIGRYQAWSANSNADVLLFCGGTTYFRKPGWMQRVVDSVSRYGKDALYGSMCNTGDMGFNVYPHIRTTGFWVGREAFNRYPVRVQQKEQRYEFEHGATGLTTWFRQQNLKVWVVGWDTEYAWPNWGNIPGGFHNGDQRNLLIGDRLSSPPYWDFT